MRWSSVLTTFDKTEIFTQLVGHFQLRRGRVRRRAVVATPLRLYMGRLHDNSFVKLEIGKPHYLVDEGLGTMNKRGAKLLQGPS